MNKILSILISTNRPYDLFAKKVVDELFKQDMSNNEVIICGTEEIYDDRIIFVKDILCINGPQGYNQAALKSCGEYLVILVDDHLPPHNINDIPKFFQTGYLSIKKYKIATLASGGTCYTGDGIDRYLMCRFPIMTHETFNALGKVIFHPNFNLKSPHYADCYLSYFLGINENECIELPFHLRSFQHERPEYIVNDYKEDCRQILLNLVSRCLKGVSYLQS